MQKSWTAQLLHKAWSGLAQLPVTGQTSLAPKAFWEIFKLLSASSHFYFSHLNFLFLLCFTALCKAVSILGGGFFLPREWLITPNLNFWGWINARLQKPGFGSVLSETFREGKHFLSNSTGEDWRDSPFGLDELLSRWHLTAHSLTAGAAPQLQAVGRQSALGDPEKSGMGNSGMGKSASPGGHGAWKYFVFLEAPCQCKLMLLFLFSLRAPVKSIACLRTCHVP